MSRQSAWLRRDENEVLAGLAARLRRPASCPPQLPAPVEARILELRRIHPGWGQRQILYTCNMARRRSDPLAEW